MILTVPVYILIWVLLDEKIRKNLHLHAYTDLYPITRWWRWQHIWCLGCAGSPRGASSSDWLWNSSSLVVSPWLSSSLSVDPSDPLGVRGAQNILSGCHGWLLRGSTTQGPLSLLVLSQRPSCTSFSCSVGGLLLQSSVVLFWWRASSPVAGLAVLVEGFSSSQSGVWSRGVASALRGADVSIQFDLLLRLHQACTRVRCWAKVW